jgi:hypothetical protein
MALLGIFSLAQIWFLPGYLVLRLLRGIHPIDKVLLAIPLSAVLNFFLVYILVLLDCYTQPVIISFFLIELLVLIYIKQIIKAPKKYSSQLVANNINIQVNFTNIMFGILALICFAQFISQIGTVFTQGDAVMSWNNWAISWFNGKIPNGLAWYPQLLPTLYSLTYQFIEDSRIELFAKISISIYPMVVLALFLRAAILLPFEKNRILWSGIVFFILVRRLWGSESTLNGYADFPLTLFCTSILYVFILAANQRNERHSQLSITYPAILISLTIGAGLMKQSGVYLGLLVPFVWLFYFRENCNWSKHIYKSILIGLVIAAGYSTWYLYQYYRIATGIEQSNLKQLASIVSLPWYESIVYGFNGITKKLSWLWVALFISSILNKNIRYLSLFVVSPFLLLWAAFVPYDYRNLAAVFPFFSISLVYGWVKLLDLFKSILPIFKMGPEILQKVTIFLVLTVMTIALSNPKYKNELLEISLSAKKQIGDPEINNLLITYFAIHPEPSLLATPYVEVSKIPGLSDRFSYFTCLVNTPNSNKPSMKSVISELNNPKIQHILLLPWCDASIKNYFSDQPEKYTIIFRHKGTVLYKVSNTH